MGFDWELPRTNLPTHPNFELALSLLLYISIIISTKSSLKKIN